MGTLARGRSATGDVAVRRLVAAYFDVSYRLLATGPGRSFLDRAAAQGGPAVHGYTSTADLVALVEDLGPSPADLLADLGCGFGAVGMEVHRRAGCRVIGLDTSRAAIVEARRRVARAGLERQVRFVLGDLSHPPHTGATGAFALDSLMFVRRPWRALAAAARSLDPPGRIFVTFVDHRGLTSESFAARVASAGLAVKRLDDVTDGLRDQTSARARVAREVLKDRPNLAGRLAMRLIVGEEAILQGLIRRGVVRRWRFTVELTG